MQIRTFYLPVAATEEMAEELNRFLRSHKIVDIKKELATIDGSSGWTFCVMYLEQNLPIFAEASRQTEKIDYKKELAPATFEIYDRLRKIRKEIADNESVAVYTVFTNKELAELAKLPELTLKSMKTVPGIGDKRIEQYGQIILDALERQKPENNETDMPY